MYIRTLIGPQAGEIVDVRIEGAKAMLADGRAIPWDAPWPAEALASGGVVSDALPTSEVGASIPTAVPVPPATVQAAKKLLARAGKRNR